MPYTNEVKTIRPEKTAYGTPRQVLEFANGGRSYFYGDSLAESEQERKDRERAVARVCERIIRSQSGQA